MISKLLSFLVGAGIIIGLGWIIGATLYNGFHIRSNIPLLVASVIWFFGGLYVLQKFNQPFNVIKGIYKKVSDVIGEKNKRKTEDDMLRLKHLLDSEILTKEEYEIKIKTLKDKYL